MKMVYESQTLSPSQVSSLLRASLKSSLESLFVRLKCDSSQQHKTKEADVNREKVGKRLVGRHGVVRRQGLTDTWLEDYILQLLVCF